MKMFFLARLEDPRSFGSVRSRFEPNDLLVARRQDRLDQAGEALQCVGLLLAIAVPIVVACTPLMA